MLRTCKKCKETKPLTTGFKKYNKKAYRWTCNECFNKNMHKWRKENKDVVTGYFNKWASENRDKWNEYTRKKYKEYYDPEKQHLKNMKYYHGTNSVIITN